MIHRPQPDTEQASTLIAAAPNYFEELTEPSSWVGRLNARFDLQHRLTQFWGGASTSVLGEIVTTGQAVFTALTGTLIVTVLTIYFLADLPRLRATFYRFVPHSRRPRAIPLGDEIFAKVGSYVLGNILISVIAGTATFVWLVVFSVPYALLLGVFVAVLDLVPLIGSTIAGIAVAAVALTVSVPVCVATIVILIAVPIGGALPGLVGALVAIPFAAAVHLIAQEVLFPRLDRG